MMPTLWFVAPISTSLISCLSSATSTIVFHANKAYVNFRKFYNADRNCNTFVGLFSKCIKIFSFSGYSSLDFLHNVIFILCLFE